jgi:hypothetical protein
MADGADAVPETEAAAEVFADAGDRSPSAAGEPCGWAEGSGVFTAAGVDSGMTRGVLSGREVCFWGIDGMEPAVSEADTLSTDGVDVLEWEPGGVETTSMASTVSELLTRSKAALRVRRWASMSITDMSKYPGYAYWSVASTPTMSYNRYLLTVFLFSKWRR